MAEQFFNRLIAAIQNIRLANNQCMVPNQRQNRENEFVESELNRLFPSVGVLRGNHVNQSPSSASTPEDARSNYKVRSENDAKI